MIKTNEKQNVKFYQCEICKFKYEDKNWADKCKEWCEKNKSCNLEITKHAFKESEK